MTKILIFEGTVGNLRIVKNPGTYCMFFLFLKVLSHHPLRNFPTLMVLVKLVYFDFPQNVNIVADEKSNGIL